MLARTGLMLVLYDSEIHKDSRASSIAVSASEPATRTPQVRAELLRGGVRMVKTIIAIAAVYLIAVVGWVTLAGTITYRTENQDADLKRAVGQLWGTPLEQTAPAATL